MPDVSTLLGSLRGKYDWKFVLFYLLLSWVFFGGIFFEGPVNMHVWRQGDSLSMTLKFYEGASFWEPQMHGLWGDNYTSGRSAGEFPILYFIVAQLWKVFGVSYFVYRLFFYLILTLGIFAFYRSLKMVFKNEFWATTLSLLLFSSPAYAVYSVSFITDGPAFSFNLIALYFLTRFALDQRKSFFWWAMVFFALAGLVKVSSLIIFVFLGFIFLLERFPIRSLGERKLLPDWKLGLGFFLALTVIVSWYAYAHLYNLDSGYKYTFNNVYPVWKVDAADGMTLLNDIKITTSRVFFSRPMVMMIFFLFFFNLTLYRKLPRIAYFSNIVVFIGVIIYFLLWAPLMGVHDYYFVAVLAVFPGVVLPFIYYLRTQQPAIIEGKYTRNALYVFMTFHFIISLSTVKLKTTAKKGDYVIMESSFVNRMKWFNNDGEKWRHMEVLGKRMASLGVSNNDKVICLSDNSFNASLFFLNRDGWTNFQPIGSADKIEFYRSKGARYMVVRDRDKADFPFVEPYLSAEIGRSGDVAVYKL
jgi:hypothetical protein